MVALAKSFVVDPDKTAKRIIAKPIGPSRKLPSIDRKYEESTARIREGEGRILAPSGALLLGHDIIPEVNVVEVYREEDAETRPIVYFVPPDRLVINSKRPSSRIILEANAKDPIEMKSRVLPWLVRAGIDVFPQSAHMFKEDWLIWYDKIIDSVWSK